MAIDRPGTYKMQVTDTCLKDDGRAIIIKGQLTSFYNSNPKEGEIGWYDWAAKKAFITHYCYLTSKKDELLTTNVEQIENAFSMECSNAEQWDALVNNRLQCPIIQVDVKANVNNSNYPWQISWMRNEHAAPVSTLKPADQSVATALFNRLKAAAPAKPLSAQLDAKPDADDGLPF